MKSRLAAVFAVTAALLAAGATGAAADKRETIKVDRAAIVGSSVIPSGTYRIELSSNPDIVRFVQGGRTVAEAPYKLGLATVVYPGNAVHYRTVEDGRDRLIKIVLADLKLAIEVSAPDGVGGDTAAASTTK
jgi:hypothetical protein